MAGASNIKTDLRRRAADQLGRRRLLAVAFLAGWVIMMLEILGGRVLAPYFGYSVFQWGALIGVVMAALACGYRLGGRVGDRPQARGFLIWALAAAAAFIVVVPPLSDLFLPSLRQLGASWGAVFASAALLAVPSILLATTSPIVIRLTASERIANSAGVVYSVSTVGSIGGTFFTAFFAIPELGTRVSHLVAAALVALAVAMMATLGGRRALAAVLLVLAVGGGGLLMPRENDWGVVYQGESVHNIIRVQDHGNHRNLYLNYTDGPQTVMVKGRLLTDSYYDSFLLGPHLNGGRKILFLGVAGGISVRQILAYYPKTHVTGVDLDPAVLEIAKRYFDLKEGPRLKLVAEDARWYLAQSKEKFDIIDIDLYVTGQIPFFTVTREFYALVHRRLTPNGIMMINILSPHRGQRLVGPFIRTVRKIFPSVFLVGHGNVILIASRKVISLAEVRRRMSRRGTTAQVEHVLSYTRKSLRVAHAGRGWPIFTDDLNDVEFRTFRVFHGG